MSIDLMTIVWDKPYPPHEKLLLLTMADSANEEGEVAVNLETLSRKTSLSGETLTKMLADLEEHGHVKYAGWNFEMHGISLPVYRMLIPFRRKPV